jgi:hypothetical protein
MMRRSVAVRGIVTGLLCAAAGLALGQATAPAGQAADAPTRLDVAHAAAPLFDDPVWHGASDPHVVWMPGKGADGKGEWWMYYTQRRATLPNPTGVDWVHGSAIGIATSKDGREWAYKGICRGDNDLGDPVKAKVTWWAPGYAWEGKTLHMFVTKVHGIFTTWTGDRTIEHFTSEDGENFKYVSTCKLSSMKCIDPMVLKIEDTWYMWYKDEAQGSHTWVARSKDLKDWTADREVIGGTGHEAPYVWRWKDAYWMIVDGYGKGLRVYKSETGLGNWVLNNTILSKPDGTRKDDNSAGYHPAVVLQDDQCVLFYFTQFGKRTVMQMAELALGEDGKVQCDRNKYAAGAATTQGK